jgi:Putative auto-transporter adhesin, head GIN domain
MNTGLTVRQGRIAAWLGLAAWLALAAPAQAQGVEGRRYTPGAFDTLVLTGTATVRLVQGAQDSIFVEGDDEAQGAVRLDLDSGVLKVHPSGAWKFWRSKQLAIVVTAHDLRRLEISGAADVVAADALRLRQLQVKISGAGSVRFDKLTADKLDFHVSGSGTGQFAGAVDDLNVRISGRCAYLGENLASRSATLIVSGAGDVRIWATKELTASVSGIANVDFWGAAAVKRTSSGITNWNDRGDRRPGAAALGAAPP